MELAIDTSTNTASIALSERGGLVAERGWQTDRNHTVELIGRITGLFQDENRSLKAVDALVVAQGPGSFNGLRVGMATAKGLAYALSIPIAAIGTLEALASAHTDAASPVCAILPIGRGRIGAATFRMNQGQPEKRIAAHITTVEQLAATIREPTLFCGQIDQTDRQRLVETLGTSALFPAEPYLSTTAGYLARLGWCRIEMGDSDDPATLQPLYLQAPSITTPKRRLNDAMSSLRARMPG